MYIALLLLKATSRFPSWGWDDGSVVKMLAMQTQRSEFKSPSPCKDWVPKCHL